MGPTSFFCISYPVITAPFVKEIVHFLLNCLGALVKYQLNIGQIKMVDYEDVELISPHKNIKNI